MPYDTKKPDDLRDNHSLSVGCGNFDEASRGILDFFFRYGSFDFMET